MDSKMIVEGLKKAVSGPDVAAVIGHGPLKAIKKINPEGLQPVLVAILSHTLNKEEETILRRGFARACEDESVYLFCSDRNLDVVFTRDEDGSPRMMVQADGGDETELRGLVEDYISRQRAEGKDIEFEIHPWR